MRQPQVSMSCGGQHGLQRGHQRGPGHEARQRADRQEAGHHPALVVRGVLG